VNQKFGYLFVLVPVKDVGSADDVQSSDTTEFRQFAYEGFKFLWLFLEIDHTFINVPNL